jgi:hypothetical protein
MHFISMPVNLNIYKSIIITLLKILKNDKVKFKLALRKHLCTHSFYSVDEFFMCKAIYNTVL